jgi:hypothetical protein
LRASAPGREILGCRFSRLVAYLYLVDHLFRTCGLCHPGSGGFPLDHIRATLNSRDAIPDKYLEFVRGGLGSRKAFPDTALEIGVRRCRGGGRRRPARSCDS